MVVGCKEVEGGGRLSGGDGKRGALCHVQRHVPVCALQAQNNRLLPRRHRLCQSRVVRTPSSSDPHREREGNGATQSFANILVDLAVARGVVDVCRGVSERARTDDSVRGGDGAEGVRDAAVPVVLGPHVCPLARVQVCCDAHGARRHRDNDGGTEPAEHRCGRVGSIHREAADAQGRVCGCSGTNRQRQPKRSSVVSCRLRPGKSPLRRSLLFLRRVFYVMNFEKEKKKGRRKKGL